MHGAQGKHMGQPFGPVVPPDLHMMMQQQQMNAMAQF